MKGKIFLLVLAALSGMMMSGCTLWEDIDEESTAVLKRTIRSTLCLGSRNRAGMISQQDTNRVGLRKKSKKNSPIS